MQPAQDDNATFNLALEFINSTNRHVFLTGKAGTGKTTFLHTVRQHCLKNMAVVAPTGVAAINAGGTTIHSFFQLPLAPFLPESSRSWGMSESIDKRALLSKMKPGKEKILLFKSLELLVIDEISMVRCDILDAIDTVLRHYRNRASTPFGGVQVLFIGDMYQLPPVVRESDWSILSASYQNPFFFNSRVFAEAPPVYIELEKVFRQQDPAFIDLLNKVRNNNIDDDGLQVLKSRYNPGFDASGMPGLVTLTTHNRKAEFMNKDALQILSGTPKRYHADVIGEFSENSYPADAILELKVGAQVMFIKNDSEKIRRYYNGKIGHISNMEDDRIWVSCTGQANENQLNEVKKETWKNIRYVLNKQSGQIEEEELGSFSQFPLRLAWSITIHKSQGLTFERLVIDAEEAFAPGQVYVALSRCTSLEGIILKSPVTKRNLFNDARIVEYAQKRLDDEENNIVLNRETQMFQQTLITGLFDFSTWNTFIRKIGGLLSQNNLLLAQTKAWLEQIHKLSTLFVQHGSGFKEELSGYFLNPENTDIKNKLAGRLEKASNWFVAELEKFEKVILDCPVTTDNRQVAIDLNNSLLRIHEESVFRKHMLNSTAKDFSLKKYYASKAAYRKTAVPIETYSGARTYVPENIANPLLYISLSEKRNEIAADSGAPVYMICSTQSLEQMSAMLPLTSDDLKNISGFGTVKVRQYGKIFLEVISDYCRQYGLDSNMDAVLPEKIKKKKAVSNKKERKDSKIETHLLLQEGKTIEEIATIRNINTGTVEGHIAQLIEIGKLDISRFVPETLQSSIRSVIREHPEITALRELKNLLPDVRYEEIKMVLADEKRLKDTKHESVTETAGNV